jgi:hypothetical protein
LRLVMLILIIVSEFRYETRPLFGGCARFRDINS